MDISGYSNLASTLDDATSTSGLTIGSMRRILRKIAAGEIEDFGDTSTLADPTVITSLLEGKKDLLGQ